MGPQNCLQYIYWAQLFLDYWLLHRTENRQLREMLEISASKQTDVKEKGLWTRTLRAIKTRQPFSPYPDTILLHPVSEARTAVGKLQRKEKELWENEFLSLIQWIFAHSLTREKMAQKRSQLHFTGHWVSEARTKLLDYLPPTSVQTAVLLANVLVSEVTIEARCIPFVLAGGPSGQRSAAFNGLPLWRWWEAG